MKKLILAILLVGLLLALTPRAAPAQGNSDEVLLVNSLRHYIQALETYNSGDYSSVAGLLQAAASNAKHANSDLASLLEQLRNEFMGTGNLYEEVAAPIADIYNDCFPCGYVFPDGYVFSSFNPSDPTAAPGSAHWGKS